MQNFILPYQPYMSLNNPLPDRISSGACQGTPYVNVNGYTTPMADFGRPNIGNPSINPMLSSGPLFK